MRFYGDAPPVPQPRGRIDHSARLPRLLFQEGREIAKDKWSALPLTPYSKPSFLEVHILDRLTKAEGSDPDLELTEQFVFASIWMARFEH